MINLLIYYRDMRDFSSPFTKPCRREHVCLILRDYTLRPKCIMEGTNEHLQKKEKRATSRRSSSLPRELRRVELS